MMKIMRCEQGVIPLLIPISIALVGMLFGAGIYAYMSGSAKTAILIFIVGVICGLVVLPNLKKIIRWFRDIKNEI